MENGSLLAPGKVTRWRQVLVTARIFSIVDAWGMLCSERQCSFSWCGIGTAEEESLGGIVESGEEISSPVVQPEKSILNPIVTRIAPKIRVRSSVGSRTARSAPRTLPARKPTQISPAVLISTYP